MSESWFQGSSDLSTRRKKRIRRTEDQSTVNIRNSHNNQPCSAKRSKNKQTDFVWIRFWAKRPSIYIKSGALLRLEWWHIGIMERRVSVIIVRIAMHALPEKQKEVMQTLLSMIESTFLFHFWMSSIHCIRLGLPWLDRFGWGRWPHSIHTQKGHRSQKYYNIIHGGIINETRNCREG